MKVTYFKEALDAYDPYGVYRVNTFQSFSMIMMVFMIDGVFNLSNFNALLFFPIFGALAICMVNGYHNRLKAMFIFSITTVIYAFFLSIVIENRYLTVFVVGMAIASFFMVAKKRYPPLLGMIPLIHIAAYTILNLSFSNWGTLLHWCFSMFILALLSIALLALFPRIYFFRIWLRVFHLTLGELEEKLAAYRYTDFATSPFVFQHFRRLPTYTAMLSYKEHGFSARKISLVITHIYVTLTALIHKAAQLDEHETQELCNICHQLAQALTKNKRVDYPYVIPSTNPCFLRLHQDILYIVRVWNQLCVKL